MEANDHIVGTLFHATLCFEVPVYQRPYVWNERQWEHLWGDMMLLAGEVLKTNSAKPHFMGAIVVDNSPRPTGGVDRRIVVDGQQRLITLQVFLEALADNYERVLEEGCGDAKVFVERARMITRNHHYIDNDASAEFKVWPMNLDQRFFEAVMTAGSPKQLSEQYGDDPKIARSLIGQAYVYFYESIRKWLDQADGTSEALAALDKVVNRYLQIVVIDLQNSVDPQLIFETLNALGTPLTASDLIKNFLFHQAEVESGDGAALYARYWQPFEDEYDYWSRMIGKGNAARPRLDVFVHHYLTMKTRKDVSVKYLYKEYRDFASATKMSTVEQMIDLERYGRVYQKLDHFEPRSRKAIFMDRLRAMDNSTIVPFLLALTGDKSVSEADCAAIMGYLESYLVRRMVSGRTTKAYNKVFLELLQATDGPGIVPQVVRDTILGWNEDTNTWPDDAAFRAAWMNRRAYDLTNARLRMVFDGIEPYVKSDKADDIAYTLGALTIEHLLPQQWHAYYPLPEDGSVSDDERDELLQTFGNLTLLTQKLNSSVSNGRWSTADDLAEDKGKRAAILEHSGLAINRMLSRYKSWDENGIKERGTTLFEAALKVWPRPSASINQHADA